MTGPRHRPRELIQSVTLKVDDIALSHDFHRHNIVNRRQHIVEAIPEIKLAVYLFFKDGYGGGLCPLIDKDGKPLTWDVK